MKFDDLDKKMRVFETAADLCVLPGMFMVARLDGRSFTRLTKEVCQFEAPFDERFRDLMVATAESLMTCGFRVLYAYTESDEVSNSRRRSGCSACRSARRTNCCSSKGSTSTTSRTGRSEAWGCIGRSTTSLR